MTRSTATNIFRNMWITNRRNTSCQGSNETQNNTGTYGNTEVQTA